MPKLPDAKSWLNKYGSKATRKSRAMFRSRAFLVSTGRIVMMSLYRSQTLIRVRKLNRKRRIPDRSVPVGLELLDGLELMRLSAPMLNASPKTRSDRPSILDRGGF